jgi:acyl transferase domain-containing protein/acyl carrier protein
MTRAERTSTRHAGAADSDAPEAIAIVGIGLRFPGGCESADDFEDLLRHGRSGIGPLPEDRWDTDALTPGTPDEKGKIQTEGGGFLDRIDLFDAPFFNISPKEAQYVDPQQRLVLETAWHALENANIDPTPLRRGNGGVYIGASSIDYALETAALPYEALDGHLASGITMFPLSGRLSYFLGWRGPSMSVDTACSSSLSALHLAVQGLRHGECDIALCGGVNALHHPSIMVMFSHGQMLARDARCKTFDEDADGYVRAEGCGILVLKRVGDAQRDGDRILALVRGTAVGQDGDSAGLTVPHGPAQEQVIRRALAVARLEPGDIQYVEAHGTGTPIGDPIELGAINDVFSDSHTKQNPLLVGSAKTNLGHMEPASGVVGVIKTVLQLRAGTVFPHLNLRTPSTRIPWDAYPVAIPVTCRPWPGESRRAVVNSFGFAGTIAATVLEQAPPVVSAVPAADEVSGAPVPAVFTLSGKSSAGLRRQIERYQEFLDNAGESYDIPSLCGTGNTGRAHFGHRLAGVVRDRNDLAKLLASGLDDETRTAAKARKTAFLFSGQGAQFAGMGAELYRRFPAFRDKVDSCDALFAEHIDVSVRELLITEAPDSDLIHRTQYTQPALFTLEYALARLWMSWGLKPNVLIGHSIGEVTAATVAGLFTLPGAVTLVAARARLMQSVRAPGGMAAVSRSVEEIEPLLTGRTGLAVAAVNAPGQCVISGDRDQLRELSEELTASGARVEQLSVSHAFHSPLMAEVFDDFREAMAEVAFQEPSIPLVSNLTGRIARFAELATPEYWVRHIGEPVRFMEGIQAVEKRGRHIFVEIGPSAALTALARQCVTGDGHHWIPSQRRRDGGELAILRALADIYVAGAPVDWAGVHAGQQRTAAVRLPEQAFERKRYWLPADGRPRTAHSTAAHPLLGQETTTQEAGHQDGTREFTAQYLPDSPAWMADHTGPEGEVQVPSAAYVELLFALQDTVYGHTRARVRDLRLHEPLWPAEESGTTVRTRLRARTGGADVEVVSGPVGGETLHATAVFDEDVDAGGTESAAGPGAAPDETWFAEPPGDVVERVTGTDVGTDLASVGRAYGERFRLLTEVRRHADGRLTGTLTLRRSAPVEQLPVEALECALHAAVALDDDGPYFAPVSFGSVRLLKKPRGEHLTFVARVTGAGGSFRTVDLEIRDEHAPVAELGGVECRPQLPPGRTPSLLHRLAWVRRSAAPALDPADRYVLALGPDTARLAALAGERGLRIAALDGTDALRAALGDPSVTDVCWFWRPVGEPGAAFDHATLRAECERNYRELLDVVAAVSGGDPARAPRLWLVTSRAQWLPDDLPDDGVRPAAATLWGFGQVLLNEYPRSRATLVDLPGHHEHAALIDELLIPDTGEYQIAHRDGQRHVRRLLAGRDTPAWHGDFEVRALEPGDTAELRPVPTEAVPPTEGLVQVRVRAAALGRRAEGAPLPALGSGCVGTVVATGPLTGIPVGTEVVVAHDGTLGSTVTVPAAAVAPAPAGLGPAEAAASCASYLTAHHALHGRAGLTAGDRVLVHGADRATVRAAVALAARAGAEVFVTARPQEEHRLRGLGAHHVLDVHDPGPAADVLLLTEGHGIDILLTVPDEPLPAALTDCLATHGRTSAVHGRPGQDDAEALAGIVAALERGELPRLPVVEYGIDELPEAAAAAEDAVRGQAVVTLPGVTAPAADGVSVRDDRSYLVTGGLGGLGLVTARKLVDLGARHLLLVSRSGTATPEATEILADLSGRATITVERADVSSPEDIARIGRLLRSGPPLGGIVHAAGAAGKSLIGNLTWEAIDAQLQAQAYGGWLLHELSGDFPELDFFFVHSSIASVLGGSTQAHYAAAFAFLDGLVAWRRRRGLPALSVNWGAWSQVGMSARLDENLGRELERGGVRFFSPARALRLFERMLTHPEGPYVAGEFDWKAYLAPSMVDNALYARLVEESDRAGGDGFDLSALLAKPEGERREAVGRVVRGCLAEVLQADDADQVEPTTPFIALGLDSLMALQLKTGLESAFRIPLPATLTFDHPSPRDLADFLDAQLTTQLRPEGGR